MARERHAETQLSLSCGDHPHRRITKRHVDGNNKRELAVHSPKSVQRCTVHATPPQVIELLFCQTRGLRRHIFAVNNSSTLTVRS